MRTLLVLGALLLAAPASAETLTVVCKTSELQNSGKQLCRPPAEYRFKSVGPGQGYKIIAKAPATHCANVSYTFDIAWPGGSRRTGTAPLPPGYTEEVWLGDGLPFGEHTLVITGYGYTGGCNTGTTRSWAIDVQVVPN